MRSTTRSSLLCAEPRLAMIAWRHVRISRAEAAADSGGMRVALSDGPRLCHARADGPRKSAKVGDGRRGSLSKAEVDLLVVGGGINGAGISRDAAGRGLSVMLVEKDDLAAHTSSASSKLIHGGLRYLEQFEFKLVRESLAERERLLRAAPHMVQPLEFII